MTVLSLVPVLLGAQQRSQDTRPGIAVLPVQQTAAPTVRGKEDFDALERGIAGMMISELSQNPAARVVERQEIQRLVDEQNLGAQGRVDPADGCESRQAGRRPPTSCSAPFVDFLRRLSAWTSVS